MTATEAGPWDGGVRDRGEASPGMAADGPRFSARERQGERGWEVEVLDPEGNVVWTRPCAGEREARTFASTVRQHASWLSDEKFREYYRLPSGG